MCFTFMLPCIVIHFFLNNQPDTLIIQIYSVINLYMFRASFLPIIRSYLLHVLTTASKQIQDLNLLGSGHQTCMKLTSAECTVENS